MSDMGGFRFRANGPTQIIAWRCLGRGVVEVTALGDLGALIKNRVPIADLVEAWANARIVAASLDGAQFCEVEEEE